MPPPITSTVAPRRIRTISSPARQQAAGSARAAVRGIEPFGQGVHAVPREDDALGEAAHPHGLGHWLTRPARHSVAGAAPVVRLAGDRAPHEASGSRRGRPPSTVPLYSCPITRGGVRGKSPWVAWTSRAADARRVDGDQHLARAGGRLGQVVEGEAGLPVPGRDAHDSRDC